MNAIWRWMESEPFFLYGFLRNRWVWLHGFLAGIYAAVLTIWLSESPVVVYQIVLWTAVGFEVWQAWRHWRKHGSGWQDALYGSAKAHFYNSLGDVISATVAATFVLV